MSIQSEPHPLTLRAQQLLNGGRFEDEYGEHAQLIRDLSASLEKRDSHLATLTRVRELADGFAIAGKPPMLGEFDRGVAATYADVARQLRAALDA